MSRLSRVSCMSSLVVHIFRMSRLFGMSGVSCESHMYRVSNVSRGYRGSGNHGFVGSLCPNNQCDLNNILPRVTTKKPCLCDLTDLSVPRIPSAPSLPYVLSICPPVCPAYPYVSRLPSLMFAKFAEFISLPNLKASNSF